MRHLGAILVEIVCSMCAVAPAFEITESSFHSAWSSVRQLELITKYIACVLYFHIHKTSMTRINMDQQLWCQSPGNSGARPIFFASDRPIWFLPGTSPRAPEKSVMISSSRSVGPCLDWPWVDCRDPFSALGVFDTFTNGMKNSCGNTWTLWEFDWIAFSLSLSLSLSVQIQ